MIAFGTCVGGDGHKYSSVSLPTIQQVASADDLVLSEPGRNGICAVYNQFIDVVSNRADCEALVLLHDDVEIHDEEFRDKVLAAVGEDSVGVVGVVGGADIPSLQWWRGRRLAGRVEEPRGAADLGARTADVDAVDGLMLVLSPRAFRSIRFDGDSFPEYHAYDVDYCLAARAAGLRVVVREIDVFHRTKGGFGDAGAFKDADRVLVGKWPQFVRPMTLREDALSRARGIARRQVARVRRNGDEF